MTILRELRIRKGLTVREVTGSVGISDSYLSGVETGHAKNPSRAILYALAKYYGRELQDIMDEHGKLKDGDPKYKTFKKPVAVQVGDLFNRVSELERRVSFLTEVVQYLSEVETMNSLRVPKSVVGGRINKSPLVVTPKLDRHTSGIDPKNLPTPVL